MFVIRRIEDQKFVTPSGSEHSYTSDLTKAKTFPTRQAAEQYGLCGNERVVPVSDLLNR